MIELGKPCFAILIFSDFFLKMIIYFVKSFRTVPAVDQAH